jgi:hypothetical protein
MLATCGSRALDSGPAAHARAFGPLGPQQNIAHVSSEDVATALTLRRTGITVPGQALRRTSEDLTSPGAFWFVGGREWSGVILESQGVCPTILVAA